MTEVSLFDRYMTIREGVSKEFVDKALLAHFVHTLHSKVVLREVARGHVTPLVPVYPVPERVWLENGVTHVESLVPTVGAKGCRVAESFFTAVGDTQDDCLVSYLESLRGMIDGRTDSEAETRACGYNWTIFVRCPPTFQHNMGWVRDFSQRSTVLTPTPHKWFVQSALAVVRTVIT